MPKPYLHFVRPMAEAEFWRIGEIALESGKGQVDEICNQIWLVLKDQSKQEIRGYYKRLKMLLVPLARADGWDLFRAMFKPHEYEEFDSFCAWIILHGQKFYEKALVDPDSLADEKWLRGRYYTGARLPSLLQHLLKIDVYGEWSHYRLIPPNDVPDRLPGQPIKVEDLPSRFPRLWERSRKPKARQSGERAQIRGPLTEEHFWTVIDLANEGGGTPGENLVEVLSQFNKTQIKKFAKIFALKTSEAYRWDLWGVAFMLLGGCSDDAFSDFRGWLVFQGKDIFGNALADAESIVGVALPWESAGDEAIEYAVSQAYEEVSGEELPPPRVMHPREPVGEEWAEEDLPRLFPRAAKFLEDSD